jgi:phosphoribosyl-AMP cyclohydrolase
MLDIKQIKFNADGLIPAVVIDTETRDVLMPRI